MITVQNDCHPIYVMVGTNEFCLTNHSVWSFTRVDTIAAGTNVAVDVGTLRTGAHIVVDEGGRLTVVDGPDLVGSGVLGFATVIGSLGTLMFIRWLGRWFRRSLGLREVID